MSSMRAAQTSPLSGVGLEAIIRVFFWVGGGGSGVSHRRPESQVAPGLSQCMLLGREGSQCGVDEVGVDLRRLLLYNDNYS